MARPTPKDNARRAMFGWLFKLLEAVLKKRPYPHFRPVAGHPKLICRIEENGSETIGRFAGREFIAVEVPR